MARKNIHGKQGVRFKAGWTASKEKSLLRNLATDLIVYEKVTTTLSTGKALVALSDRLVTYAKAGTLASRRQAARIVRDRVVNKKLEQTALQKLFDVLAPRYAKRNGGYTRILKVENRQGDNALVVQVSLVTDEA